MQQFIPFEDDWDALEKMRPEALVPYQVGFVSVPETGQPRVDGSIDASACLQRDVR